MKQASRFSYFWRLCASTALRSPLLLAFTSAVSFYPLPLLAAPQDGEVKAGNAGISTTGLETHINQSSSRAIIDWRSFDVAPNELVQFHQPSSTAVTLNRVNAATPSRISGSIKANGNVVIINPNGVFFDSTSRVDVNSLVVTSSDIENSSFMAGQNNFTIPGAQNAKITNNGVITVKDAGLVGLVAPQVENNGVINARLGRVQAASGDSFTLDLYGDGLISVAVSGEIGEQIVRNTGTIAADGGSIKLTAAAARTAVDSLLVNTGTLRANSIGNQKGEILLNSEAGGVQNTGAVHAKGSTAAPGGRVSVRARFASLGGEINVDGSTGGTIDIQAGTVSLADTISARGLSLAGGVINIISSMTWETSTSRLIADGSTHGGSIRHFAGNQLISSGFYSAAGSAGDGGQIDVSAYSTKFLSATIDASGTVNGGTVRLGGEYQGGGGSNPLPVDQIPNATYLVLDRGTRVRARSNGNHGRGGTTILWSDKETLALGEVDATPGLQSGDGGFVEVSSAGMLNYDATAKTGRGTRAGQVLLDPKNIVISDFSFNATAIIMGYGYMGGQNIQTGLDTSDAFGFGVALDGNRMAVGSRQDDGFNNTLSDSGAVYLYSFTDSAFNGAVLEGIIGHGYTGGKNINLAGKVRGTDWFGNAVSLDGYQLAVGAELDNGLTNGTPDAGAVYLFNFTDMAFSGGQHVTTVGRGYSANNSYLANGDRFGYSVYLDGNRLAVGAMADDGEANAMTDSGAIYLYTFADDNFTGLTLQSRIGYGYNGAKDFNLSRLEGSDNLGSGVALDGNMLIAGAWGDDGAANSLSNVGAVYMFTFADSSFSTPALRGTIGHEYNGVGDVSLPHLLAADTLGRGIDIDNRRIAIGSSGNEGKQIISSDSGAIYLLTTSDNSFSSTVLDGVIGVGYTSGKNIDLMGNGLASGDRFGYSLSLDGNRLVSGAYLDDGHLNATIDSGAVYMFTFGDSAFNGGTFVGMMGAGYSEGKHYNVTGINDVDTTISGLALKGRMLAIGDQHNDGYGDSRLNSGAVYLYSFSDDEMSNPTLQAIIGEGYTGGKNYNQSLRSWDNFGRALAFENNRLAVGAPNEDGITSAVGSAGAVFLYTFDDATFSNISLAGRVGVGYTGGKNINMSGIITGSDVFGSSLDLDGNRLVVGAASGDGYNNVLTDSGEIYLFTFTDNAFSGGQLVGTIGRGYTGTKDVNITSLDSSDNFATSLDLDGNRLVVGAQNEDGVGNVLNSAGAVYLITFADSAFSGGQWVGTIGHGYTGGKNIDQQLALEDYYGIAVALSGNYLFVGARADDGAGNAVANSGAVYKYLFSDATFSNGAAAGIIGARYTGTGDIDLRGHLGSNDLFGRLIAVDGRNIAIVSESDDGFGNNAIDSGAVYLLRASDLTYQSMELKRVIGQGYGAPAMEKNIHVPVIMESDNFGSSVSLDGNRLAVGAQTDDGFANNVTDAGAVYLFSFSDASFSGGKLEGIIGHGYTGGKNIDLSAYLETTDGFGFGVSLDGQMLAASARYDDGVSNGVANAGAVYLINFTDSSFSGGALRGIIGHGYTGGNNINTSPAGVEAGDQFGFSVSLDNNRLAVGAPEDDGSANARSNSGAVYLYTFSDSAFSTGTLRKAIGYNYAVNLALENGDIFGRSVSLSGNRLAVGAPYDDGNSNGRSDSGAVYLYSFNDSVFTTTTLEGRLGHGYTGGKNFSMTSYLDVTDNFGSAVSLDGNRLAVSSGLGDGYNNGSLNPGEAYLFTFSDSAFNGTAVAAQIGFRYTGGKNIDLRETFNGDVTDGFNAISLDGNRLVFAAPADDYNVADSGTVTMITFADSTFSGGAIRGMIGNGFARGLELPVLHASGDSYGTAVSLNDNRIVVGVPDDDGINDIRGNAGAVYLYSVPSGNFSTIKLEGIIGYGYTGGKNVDISPVLDKTDAFGASVSLNGNRLVIGAPNDDGVDNNRGDTGSVYLFTFSDAAFSGAALAGMIGNGYSGTKSYSLALGGSDFFGYAVSLDGNRLAVGAYTDDGNSNLLSDSGAVYLFTFADSLFSTPVLQATMGHGYTGGKNVNVTLGASDTFGSSLSLDGRRLAVGSFSDDGLGDAVLNAGAVYLYTFTDDAFSGGASAGIIGYGYNGANDYNMSSLYAADRFGSGVALQNNLLAIGAFGDDGMNQNNTSTDANVNSIGGVHIFTFSDLVFNGKTLDSSIGVGYTGGKNINASPYLPSSSTQNFGRSVSMDDGTLIVGVPNHRGANVLYNGSGAVMIFRTSLSDPSSAFSFSNLNSSTIGITAASLATLLATPQNVTLQASNDIIISSNLLVDNPSGAGGTLTLQAGRSILINAIIDTDNGNLNLYANEKASTGVVNAQRDAGAAAITMGTGSSINTGTGTVTFRVDNGAGNTNNTAGNITLTNVTAGSILVTSNAETGNVILNGILTAANSGDAIVLDAGASLVNNAGAGALVASHASGRWLVYTDHADLNTLGGLSAGFSANRCVYGDSCSVTVPATGNALLYQYGQNLLQISINTTKQYGDAIPNSAALQPLYTYSGFVGSDTASVLDVLPTATVSGIAIGTTPGNSGTITLSGGSDNFYDYYLVGGTMTITKRDITAAWVADLSKSYGDLNPTVNTSNFVYTGLYGADTNASLSVSADYGTTTAATGVGSYGIGAIFTASNYNVTNAPTATLTINKRDIAAAWNSTLSRIYGDANPSVSTSNFTYTGLVNGDTGSVLSAAASYGSIGSSTNAGNHSVGATFSAANYNVTNSPTTTLAIGKRDITAVVGNQSRAYGDANPALDWNHVTFSNLANSESGSVLDTVTIAAATATATSAAGGTHNITLSVADNNYNLLSYTQGTLSIIKRNITAVWNAALTKVYGSANPAVSSSNFTYSSLVNGDTNAVVTATADFGSADSNSNVGTYGVGATFSAANYNITNAPAAVLTITPKALNVSTTAAGKTYGDADPAFTGSIGGLTAHDSALISWSYAPVGYSGNAGTYQITATATDSSNRLANYTRTNSYANLVVSKRNITAAIDNKSRIYGDLPSYGRGDAVWSNLASGETAAVLDNVSFTVAGAQVGDAAGTSRNVSVSVVDGNYNLAGFTSGIETVIPAELIIRANDVARNSSAPAPVFNASYNGFRNGQTEAVVSGLTLSSNAPDLKTSGRYIITPAGASAANYTITYVNGEYVIKAIDLIPATVEAAFLAPVQNQGSPAISILQPAVVPGLPDAVQFTPYIYMDARLYTQYGLNEVLPDFSPVADDLGRN